MLELDCSFTDADHNGDLRGIRRPLKPGFHPNAINCVACVACVAFGWKLKRKRSVEAVATMIGCLPTQALAFGWKPGFNHTAQYTQSLLAK